MCGIKEGRKVPIQINDLWDEIDKKYVGFSPNTTSIKPVHIANGLFRTSLNYISDTKSLNRFVFWQKADGNIPPGHELEAVFRALEGQNRIDNTTVSMESLKHLRVLMKKILNADDGVYTHGMDSYSGGYMGFLSKDYVGQSGGELIALWLRSIRSPLLDTIINSINEPSDIITALCYPLLESADVSHNSAFDIEDIKFLNMTLPPAPNKIWNGLAKAAETLNKHIKAHPNKLQRLRLAILFACFVLNRHLTSLESYYVPGAEGKVQPLLLDFSENSSDPVSKASTMTYTYSCQSISRFYTWAFSERLMQDFSKEDLLREGTPTYQGNTTNETNELWSLTIEEARSSDYPYVVCGQAIYDILALQAKGDPIRYFRQLGIRSGLMWPPIQPGKRFAAQQDMLEMLIRASVEPGSVMDLNTLQDELWNRFGIVIGGRSLDDERLIAAGVYQADSSALRTNRDRFASRLNSLDFAKLLADGVLQIELEVINA